MKVQVCGLASSMFKIVCVFLVLQFGPGLSQGPSCPFEYLYHFGDGVTDNGNSIYVLPKVQIPAGRKPYGMTYPGYPTGRWSDGRVDFDYTAEDFGLPEIVPYLNMNHSRAAEYHGVIFSTARSPVLDFSFFKKRNIVVPPYAVPLSTQMRWFKRHLKTICDSRSECSEWIGSSLVLMGDIEGNDITYALTQGKTIKEARSYVPAIIKAQIDATRETIKLGARRVIIPGNGPLGCYPFILTALQTKDPTAYDELGCLKSVNELAVWKNDYLLRAMDDLRREFPNVLILYGGLYDGIRTIIANASVIGKILSL
ncbi:GDSL esterase/lipase [Striga asiatica]|uniref:GDSL esterase/lipase n=1 Tax=Striga asiatica TaxID=4170 RepID=A0A5A7P584_STRAF|nr:GDSL esterase/lipase [Striga asiatica]